MTEQLQVRVHGAKSLPALVYLPGLHGDWTLVGGFRKALAGHVRFVELTYPRTLTWSLDDYATGVEEALAVHGITSGWLLGESFGSQVVWPLLARQRFSATGVILTGGFVHHPMRWGVRFVERICGEVSLSMLTRIIFGYSKVARFRYRHSSETLSGLEEFINRRTKLDRQAAKHRLHLVAGSDPSGIAKRVNVPVYALTGLWDPIVPWFLARRSLHRNCPALREYKIIRHADHNVLGTAPEAAAHQVLEWIAGERS